MIYFIQGETSKAIKIGIATDPVRRVTQLQVGSPETLILLGTISGNRKTEQDLHKRFKAFRARGEWFRYTSEFEAAVREIIGSDTLCNYGVTVAQRLLNRNNCRAGLNGLLIRHAPTGLEFFCQTTTWDAGQDLRLFCELHPETPRVEMVARMAARLGEGTPEYLRTVNSYDKYGITCAADIEPKLYPKNVSARECVLLDEWPVVCCPETRRYRSVAR